jgi:hypothetical protein
VFASKHADDLRLGQPGAVADDEAAAMSFDFAQDEVRCS